jgi:hypothetical protein
MGGFLSTRWSGESTKLLTSGVPHLEARRYFQLRCHVPRAVYLAPIAPGQDQPVFVTWTPCHYGGARPWFECPLCHRRAGKLYLRRVWLCRICARLAYGTTRVGKPARLDHWAWKLERRLGLRWNADQTWWRVTRPKGMHRRTFDRLLAEWKAVRIAEDMAREEELLRGLARWLPRLEAQTAALQRRRERGR